MVISHLKHSYLNWRAIPCNFSSFSQFFLASWFLFRLKQNFQVHDMTINFPFFVLFIFSFSRSHGLSTPGNDACHRWPSKLLMWGLFWKAGLLVQSCLYRFCPKRRLWLKSVPEKWVFFGQHVPRHQSGYFRISRS